MIRIDLEAFKKNQGIIEFYMFKQSEGEKKFSRPYYLKRMWGMKGVLFKFRKNY